MLTLALAMLPKPAAVRRDALPAEAEEGLLGKLLLWARQRVGEQIRYRQAMRELNRLADRDLDDLNLGRADFPELARRHADLAG